MTTSHNHNQVIERAIDALRQQIHIWPNGKTSGHYVMDNANEALNSARPVIEALTDALANIVESVADHGGGLSASERAEFREAIGQAIDDTTYDARHYNEGVDDADTRADWLYDSKDAA